MSNRIHWTSVYHSVSSRSSAQYIASTDDIITLTNQIILLFFCIGINSNGGIVSGCFSFYQISNCFEHRMPNTYISHLYILHIPDKFDTMKFRTQIKKKWTIPIYWPLDILKPYESGLKAISLMLLLSSIFYCNTMAVLQLWFELYNK